MWLACITIFIEILLLPFIQFLMDVFSLTLKKPNKKNKRISRKQHLLKQLRTLTVTKKLLKAVSTVQLWTVYVYGS